MAGSSCTSTSSVGCLALPQTEDHLHASAIGQSLAEIGFLEGIFRSESLVNLGGKAEPETGWFFDGNSCIGHVRVPDFLHHLKYECRWRYLMLDHHR